MSHNHQKVEGGSARLNVQGCAGDLDFELSFRFSSPLLGCKETASPTIISYAEDFGSSTVLSLHNRNTLSLSRTQNMRIKTASHSTLHPFVILAIIAVGPSSRWGLPWYPRVSRSS